MNCLERGKKLLMVHTDWYLGGKDGKSEQHMGSVREEGQTELPGRSFRPEPSRARAAWTLATS